MSRPKLNQFGFPSRNDSLMHTEAEKAIADAIAAVERAGCHVLLTEAVCLLLDAKGKVADFVELEEPKGPRPVMVDVRKREGVAM